MSSEGIPLAAYGRDVEMARKLQAQLAPDIDLVHPSLTLEDALTEIPSMLVGSPVPPACGIGSNASRAEKGEPLRGTKIVLFGGAIPDEETEQVKAAARKTEGFNEDEVTWVRITKEELQKITWPPTPEAVVKVLKGKLVDLGLLEGQVR
ncbi:hypothetical protein H2201_005751 [Coniosporium apollinis]|uniref:Uncharacterized protein n=1 Tax=Coniosporium apollinis TaxID=61459 RepID=A0ABQ9NQQ7_9PEZI|nr:hypothetical protein H2201_005751 [Coniosporium apollinis]